MRHNVEAPPWTLELAEVDWGEGAPPVLESGVGLVPVLEPGVGLVPLLEPGVGLVPLLAIVQVVFIDLD